MTDIICFGTGRIFYDFLDCYDDENINIVALCDNNKQKWGTYIRDIKVIPVDELLNFAPTIQIVITTAYYEEIKEQLLEMGIHEHRIVCFGYMHRYYFDKEILRNLKILKKDINVCSNTNIIVKQQEIDMLAEKTLFIGAKKLIWELPQKINSLSEVEFQVFSQFGEDGIIQWLIKNVNVFNDTFVEFGVSDYVESNTRFLLMNNDWSGLVIDGSKKNINKIKDSYYYWRHDLQAVDAFITKENINDLISSNGIKGNIGLLSVDIDGNDYWVLKALTCIRPSIMICEYNNIYGDEASVSIPYDEKFYRTDAHYSNLYWGASLKAFKDYAESKGYVYVGSNSAGHNAFFVLRECIDPDLIPGDAMFKESKYRESIDESGKMTYLRGKDRIKEIQDMELVNLKNNHVEIIRDIYNL